VNAVASTADRTRQTEDIAMLITNRAAAGRPLTRRWLLAAAGLALGAGFTGPAQAQETIKVGILHSLSGTMAISETTLKDVMLMLIEEQNKKGGVLGKFAKAQFSDGILRSDINFNQKTNEIDLNYVIKQFNARIMLFYKDTRFDAVRTNFKQVGVGMQLQM